MDKTTDIAIIGGGLASLAAALALQDSGKEITLIRKAPGAAALSCGALEMGDSPLRYPAQSWEEFPPVEENLRQILLRKGHHPLEVWRQAWGWEKLFSILREQTRALIEKIPLALGGDGNYPMALATEMGAVQPVGLVQASMGPGDLRAMKGADLLVVGIEGLAGFRASFIAQSLAQAGRGYFQSVEGAEVQLPFLKSKASLSPFEIAEALDQEEGRKAYEDIMEATLAKKKVSHVLLPPVIGMIRTMGILKDLEKTSGRTFAETLAGLPSVPGWRLSEAILRYFQLQGYDILPAEVVGYEGQNHRIKALKMHRGPERFRLAADKVILATGKFIGGGIQDRGSLREPIFGLPLFLQGKPLEQWQRSDLLNAKPTAHQPLFSAGIRVNHAGQVLGNQGEILWENLFACGRTLSGIGVGGDRSASAVSLVSGAVAGRECRS
jgi:glycerol-3-phosphate dehydrogenase subunit B